MIYTFDKKQNILRVLDENNFLTAELTFKINEATTFSFTVTPEYELTDKEKYVALPHPLDQTKFIMLRLISRTDNKDDIEYTAYEYAYQELSTSGYIKDTRPQNANALTLMTKALDGSGWSVGRTTVAGTATTNFYYTDYLSAVSKVVDLLGGEIVFYVEITGNKITGRYMDYLFRQGVDTSKVFADGSNLLSVARKKQSDSIYTAILPRGKGEQVSDGGGNEPDGYGRRIDIKDVVWSTANGKPLNKPAGSFILEDPQATVEYGQANGNARLLIQNFDEVDDPNVLIQQAYNTLMTMNHPLIEYSATVSDVGTLSLGDTVLIMHGQRNLSYKTRVFQVKYDLLHSENTELSLGDNLSSNNITSQINAIRSSIQTNSNQQAWTVSQLGRQSTTFGATQPTEPKIGDTWFKSLPDGNVEIWHYNGTIWVKVITPTTGEEIAKAVDDAIAQANENTATAIEQNNASQQEMMDDIAKSQADLAIKDADFINKAQAMADRALSDAKSNAAQVAQETLNSANDSIAQAKYAITDAYKNADGVISKKVDDTATSIGNTISQNKIDSDGKISTAQSTATQALNEVTTKVSQTVYDQKTGDLTTAVSKAQTTADGAVITVGNYKTSNDGRVKAAESKIDQNSKDITARVTQTDYNNNNSQLNTRFTKVEATADEASTTVSKLQTTVNNLGQVNQLFNTEFTPDLQGWTLDADKGSNAPYASFVGYGSRGIGFNTLNSDASTFARLSQTILLPNTRLSIDVMSLTWRVNTRRMDNYCHIWLVWQDANGVSLGQNTMGNWNDSTLNKFNVLKWENISIPVDAKQVDIRFETREGTQAYLFQPMVSFTDTIGTYVPGNYNNNAALAQVKITADGISNIVSNPTTGLSVRVQTAEGTLNTVKSTADGAMSKANQTANDITQEISDRGTGDTNTLQSAKTFTQSSISGYDTGLQTQLTQTNSAFLATISASNLVLDSSLTDSAFSGSIVNWIPSGAGKWYYSPGISYQGVQSMGYNQTSDSGTYSFVDSQTWSSNSFSGSTLNVSVDVKANAIGGTSTDYLIVILMEQDNNGNQTQRTDITATISKTNNNWVNYRKKITINPLSRTFFIRYQMRGNGNVYVARPYVGVQELIPGGYTAGSNNNNQTILSLFKDNWSIGITDNIGKITSGIVGNSSSMSLISKNIVLDGNTTVTGDFYAKGGNFKNLNASNLTVGTLNGNQVNITNLNASNIVSGAISGANLNINLNTGQVVFQHGRIYNDDSNYKGIDINIDQSYIATKDYLGYSTLANGGLYLSQTRIIDPSYDPYFSIDNNNTPFGTLGALLLGRNGVAIATEGNSMPTVIGGEIYNGLLVTKGKQTVVAGASNGVMISGGKEFDNTSPFINVGATNMITGTGGDRVQVYAKYFHLPLQWSTTTSSGANMYISSDGAVVRSSSSSKYKLDIEYEQQAETANRLLTIDPATWHDKFESKQLDKFHEIGVDPERTIDMSNRRYYGIIAEDLVKAGLEHLVSRNVETGEVEGVEYSKIGVALIPIVRDLRNRLNDQNVEIERLKEKIK